MAMWRHPGNPPAHWYNKCAPGRRDSKTNTVGHSTQSRPAYRACWAITRILLLPAAWSMDWRISPDSADTRSYAPAVAPWCWTDIASLTCRKISNPLLRWPLNWKKRSAKLQQVCFIIYSHLCMPLIIHVYVCAWGIFLSFMITLEAYLWKPHKVI